MVFDNFGVVRGPELAEARLRLGQRRNRRRWDFSQGAKLNKFEQRDYDISRERAGGGLNFDYKPDDLSSYYLRTLYSRYTDTETRNARQPRVCRPPGPWRAGCGRGQAQVEEP